MHGAVSGWTISALLLFTTPAFSASDFFGQGVESFKQQRYQDALGYFLLEKQAGNSAPELQYNLAVTHYKLGQYEQAKEHFVELVKEQKWGGLARYNLALIAEKQGDDGEAVTWLETVAGAATNTALSRLAQRKLSSLLEKSETAPDTSLLLSLTYGYDDNPFGLNAELQSDASRDSYYDALIWGRYRQPLSDTLRLEISGYAFSRAYQTIDSLDTDSLLAELAGIIRIDSRLNVMAGAEINYTTLDDNLYSRQLSLPVAAIYNLEKTSIQLTYAPAYVEGGEGNEAVDGIRHRLGGDWRMTDKDMTYGLSYRYDHDSRDEIPPVDGTAGISRDQHRLAAELKWRLTSKYTLTAGSAYRQVRYKENLQITDLDGEVKNDRRRTREFSAKLGFLLRIDNRWRLQFSAESRESRDTFDVYDHRRHRFGCSLSYFY